MPSLPTDTVAPEASVTGEPVLPKPPSTPATLKSALPSSSSVSLGSTPPERVETLSGVSSSVPLPPVKSSAVATGLSLAGVMETSNVPLADPFPSVTVKSKASAVVSEPSCRYSMSPLLILAWVKVSL